MLTMRPVKIPHPGNCKLNTPPWDVFLLAEPSQQLPKKPPQKPALVIRAREYQLRSGARSTFAGRWCDPRVFFNFGCLSRSIAAMIGMVSAGSSGSSAAGPSSVPAAGTPALVALARWDFMRRSCIKSKEPTTRGVTRFAACSSAMLRARASSPEPHPSRAHHCHCQPSRSCICDQGQYISILPLTH